MSMKEDTMAKVERQAAQGDVMFLRVDNVPATAEAAKPSARIVVAHSETGHHHTIESPGAALFTVPGDPWTCYLQLAQDADVVHHRSFDTHAPITLSAGAWLVRRQREYTPEGYRMVQD